jgi:hypothetical protein
MPGCETPIRSTTDLTMWWTALLPRDTPTPSLSMMWLDRRGRMQGRVLHVTGMPEMPAMTALRPLLDAHDGIIAREPEASGHLAMLLSRDGDCAPSPADDEWAEIFEVELEDRIDESWSFHVAAGGRVTPVTEHASWRFRYVGMGVDLFSAALALKSLPDHNSGHDDAVSRRGEGELQQGDRRGGGNPRASSRHQKRKSGRRHHGRR